MAQVPRHRSSSISLVKLEEIQSAQEELAAILAKCPDATLAELTQLIVQGRAMDFARGRVDSLRTVLTPS